MTASEIQRARLSGDLPRAMRLIHDEAATTGNLSLSTGHQYALTLIAAQQYRPALEVLALLASKVPGNAQVRLQMGQCFEILGEYVSAKDAFRLATLLHAKDEKQPDSCRAWFGLGACLFRLGKFWEAEAAWQHGLAEPCTGRDALFQRAQVKMALGDYKTGWQDYEARKQLRGYADSIRARGLDPEALPPEWDGKAQGRVLVIGTLGAGDVIQFSRYLPIVAERSKFAPKLVSGKPLEPFLGYTSLSPCDYSVAIDSLPLVLGMPEPIPQPPNALPLRSGGYRRPRWKRGRVGVCWKGAASHMNNADRSSPINFREAFASPDYDIVSLQAGEGFSPKDYQDTADLIARLDAVATVDTSVVHVAGTLGVPTVLIPPTNPEYRWGISGETSPWYPSVHIVRRKRWDDWIGAIARAQLKLREIL